MGVAYNGGVILGADSRTSTGDFVANRASDKITKLADKVYICRSGSAADTQNLSMYVQHYIQQHEMEIGRDIEVRMLYFWLVIFRHFDTQISKLGQI